MTLPTTADTAPGAGATLREQFVADLRELADVLAVVDLDPAVDLYVTAGRDSVHVQIAHSTPPEQRVPAVDALAAVLGLDKAVLVAYPSRNVHYSTPPATWRGRDACVYGPLDLDWLGREADAEAGHGDGRVVR